MTGTYPRARVFAAAVRRNLPSSPGDFLACALTALIPRFLLGMSLAATAAVTAGIIAGAVLLFAAADCALPHLAGPQQEDGDEGDG